jgi:DNA-binding NtrC family response regulator
MVGGSEPIPKRDEFRHLMFVRQKTDGGTLRTMADAPLVYVVDDEGTIATTTALILNHNGYGAIAFTQPLKALEAAQMRCPDFLITDVSMRAMNGIELAVKFQQLHPSCKVLLCSGALSTGPLLEGAVQKGFEFTILAKPVPPDDLLAALTRMGSAK